MESRITEEELYQDYCQKMTRIEEELEEYQYQKRQFETEKEESATLCSEESQSIEFLSGMYGDSEDIGIVRSGYFDFIDEEDKYLAQAEETLEMEYKRIGREQTLCEDSYREELKKLAEEED